MGNQDEFDLDVRLMSGGSMPASGRPEPLAAGTGGITCPDTCHFIFDGGHTCADTCHDTCAVLVDGGHTCAATCANTCHELGTCTCQTQCGQNTCTRVTCSIQNTCPGDTFCGDTQCAC